MRLHVSADRQALSLQLGAGFLGKIHPYGSTVIIEFSEKDLALKVEEQVVHERSREQLLSLKPIRGGLSRDPEWIEQLDREVVDIKKTVFKAVIYHLVVYSPGQFPYGIGSESYENYSVEQCWSRVGHNFRLYLMGSDQCFLAIITAVVCPSHYDNE